MRKDRKTCDFPRNHWKSFVYSFFGEDISGLKYEGENITASMNNLLIGICSQDSFLFGGDFVRKLRITTNQKELHEKNRKFKQKIGDIIKAKYELYLKNKLPNNLLYIFFRENPDLNSQLDDLIHKYI